MAISAIAACNHSFSEHVLQKVPCAQLSTIKRIAIVAFHVLTGGLFLLFNWLSSHSNKAQASSSLPPVLPRVNPPNAAPPNPLPIPQPAPALNREQQAVLQNLLTNRKLAQLPTPYLKFLQKNCWNGGASTDWPSLIQIEAAFGKDVIKQYCESVQAKKQRLTTELIGKQAEERRYLNNPAITDPYATTDAGGNFRLGHATSLITNVRESIRTLQKQLDELQLSPMGLIYFVHSQCGIFLFPNGIRLAINENAEVTIDEFARARGF